MQPALFLWQFPKQEVCCEVSLKKQAVTTGLSPGAGHGADGEPLRRCSCKYEFCYPPAFQCGFISKAGVFLASLSLPVAQIHQRLSAPNFLLLSGGIWEPIWSLAVRLNLSYKYQNLSQNPIVGGDAVLCRQSPWRGIAVALVAVAGCTCVPGPPTPLGSVQGRGRILFILLDLGSIPWCLRGFGHLSWAAWTREGGRSCLWWGGLGAKCSQSGWQQHGARLRLRAQGAGFCMCVSPASPYPLLWSACTARLLCLCVLQGGSGGAIPHAVLPAMCLCLIRGHQRPKISFLLVLGLRFLNHLALSFVFCDGNNSTLSVGQDRCFPSRGCLPLSWTAF